MQIKLQRQFRQYKFFFFLLLVIPLASFSAQTTYGPTKSTDHLWRIAVKIRAAAGVSVQQIMLALLNDNPRAFKHRNVNGLLDGQILTLPSLEEIDSIPAETAQEIVADQNSAWNHKESVNKINKKKVQQPLGRSGTKKTTEPQLTSLDVQKTIARQIAKQNDNTQKQFDAVKQKLQSSIDSQHELKEEIDILTAKNTALENQMTSFAEQQKDIQLSIMQIQNVQASIQQRLDRTLYDKIASYIKDPKNKQLLGYAGALLALLLILTLSLILMRKRKKRLSQSIIGSEDAAAKLDLARAYINMGDKTEAEKIIKEILETGSPEHQSQARELLKSVND